MTARERRALLVGGGVILGAVLALRVLPAGVRALLALRSDVAERGAVLARAEEEVTLAGRLADSAAVVTRALGVLAPRLLSGAGAEEALADLSGRLAVAARGAAARVERVESVATADTGRAGRLRAVRARAALEGDVRGLARFLAALASDAGLVTVDAIHVVAVDPLGAIWGPESLRWEVTVTGWRLGGTL
jgi:hypothetical protein